MSLVTVFRSFSPAEAQLVRSRLDAAGIPATVTNEAAALSTEGYALTVGGVRVQVPSDHEQDALDLIHSKASDELPEDPDSTPRPTE